MAISTTIAPSTVPETCKASFLNANGFIQWNQNGTLLGAAVPQEAQFNAYASIYKFYCPERICLTYTPTRLQFDVNGSNQNQDAWNAPTMMGTLPESQDLIFFTPVSGTLNTNDRIKQMCARKIPKIVLGY